eukprot:gene31301-51579_t
MPGNFVIATSEGDNAKMPFMPNALVSRVARHYSVPLLDYRGLVLAWAARRFPATAELNRTQRAQVKDTFWPPAAFEGRWWGHPQWPAHDMIAAMLARWFLQGMASAVCRGGWRLYADVPGKPGWISTTPGSNLTFMMQFGGQPQLRVEWLRSYEGFGNAELTVEGRRQA